MSERPFFRNGFLARWRERRTAAGWSEGVVLLEFVAMALAAFAVIAAAFWFTLRFVRPAPPAEFAISTGGAGGVYQIYARRYGELLAHEGLRVEARASNGSVENLGRLADPASGVSVAFVQGGVGNPEHQPDLVTLAALYYEPLWVFYRGTREITLLAQLAGKRIAIGPEGSGSRSLAQTLLAESKVAGKAKQLLPLGGVAAAEALKAGRVDAAIFVAGADAPYVQDLLRATGVRLMHFGQAQALSRRFPYLAAVTVPRGVIDIAADIPPRDVTLVAATAYLVARQDFHPALVAALLDAVKRVHRGGGVFHRTGEFPAAREGDFPLSEEAQRFFSSGPPFLQRYLPFWIANLVQRLLILLVPLVAVAIPLLRFLPGMYGWRMRARVYRWYRELRAVEAEADQQPGARRAGELIARLDAIDEGVGRARVPLAYSDYAYNLKIHVNLVRTRLQRLAESSDGGTRREGGDG